VTAERSRTVVLSRSDTSGEATGERTYREEEVAAILQRAAQLERLPDSGEGVLNLREIEEIARDSGIDLSLVRQAARELEDEERVGIAGTIAAALAGAPVRRSLERVVDGEIGAEHHEQLAQEIHEVLSASGVGTRITSIGRSLTLSGFVGTSAIELNIAPREGRTFIRIGVDRSQLAGGLFGGIVGGVGGGFGANVGWMIPTLLHLPAVAGLAGAGAVVFGAYLLARGIFANQARGVDRRLDALADRLETVIRSAGYARSRPSSAV
jgi:hypothetical protein